MDPLTAFSLAGTVLQVVDFGFKFTGVVRDMSAHGAKEELIEIESENAGLNRLITTLQNATISTGPAPTIKDTDSELFEVCRTAKTISDELAVLLKSLRPKVSSSKTTRDMLWKAVKAEWKDAEIKTYQNRLDRLERRTQTLLQVKYGSEVMTRLQTIELQARNNGVVSRQLDKLLRDIHSEIRGSQTGDVASLTRLMLSAADKGRNLLADLIVFEQLRFPGMDSRIKMLDAHPAHDRTLLWVNQQATTNGDTHAPTSFASWISSERQLFWISGKPGSGKSSLMQHLFSRHETKQGLAEWAKGHELLIAAYFFWEIGGVGLLRKQEGLLRTLIYQVLKQYPDMIKDTYKEQYSVYNMVAGNVQGDTQPEQRLALDVSLHGLLETMQKICDYVKNNDLRLCLFVDGLDEYDGKPAQIIKLIRSLQNSPHVKVCCASRPENSFSEAFGNIKDKLFMEEFNKQDIEIYVEDRLSNNHLFKELDAEETTKLSIATEIVESAQGVFLWVTLVLEELLLGLENRDTMRNLQDRLRAMPKDLMPFFQHMLQRVDEFYRRQSALILMVALTCQHPLSSLAYWYISEADVGDIQMPKIAPLTFPEIRRYRKDIKNRLNACCKGLLQVQHASLDPKTESLPSSTIFSQTINFLHRTVREFLSSQAARAVLDPYLPAGCDFNMVVCRAVLAQIRSSPTDSEYFAIGGPIAFLWDLLEHHLADSGTSTTNPAGNSLKREIAETVKTLESVTAGSDTLVPQNIKEFGGYGHDTPGPTSTATKNGSAGGSLTISDLKTDTRRKSRSREIISSIFSKRSK